MTNEICCWFQSNTGHVWSDMRAQCPYLTVRHYGSTTMTLTLCQPLHNCLCYPHRRTGNKSTLSLVLVKNCTKIWLTKAAQWWESFVFYFSYISNNIQYVESEVFLMKRSIWGLHVCEVVFLTVKRQLWRCRHQVTEWPSQTSRRWSSREAPVKTIEGWPRHRQITLKHPPMPISVLWQHCFGRIVVFCLRLVTFEGSHAS